MLGALLEQADRSQPALHLESMVGSSRRGTRLQAIPELESSLLNTLINEVGWIFFLILHADPHWVPLSPPEWSHPAQHTLALKIPIWE